MPDVKKYQLTIGGETIKLVSDENIEYIQSLSRYLDKFLDDLNRSSLANSPNATKYLYASVFLTDLLLKEQEKVKALEAENTSKSQSAIAGSITPPQSDKGSATEAKQLQKLKNENMRLKKLVESKSKELDDLRKELDDFIREFDSKEYTDQPPKENL